MHVHLECYDIARECPPNFLDGPCLYIPLLKTLTFWGDFKKYMQVSDQKQIILLEWPLINLTPILSAEGPQQSVWHTRYRNHKISNIDILISAMISSDRWFPISDKIWFPMISYHFGFLITDFWDKWKLSMNTPVSAQQLCYLAKCTKDLKFIVYTDRLLKDNINMHDSVKSS